MQTKYSNAYVKKILRKSMDNGKRKVANQIGLLFNVLSRDIKRGTYLVNSLNTHTHTLII